MSFQTIINNASSITIDDRPITSAVMSRSNRLKTAQRGISIYRIGVSVGRAFQYTAANRAMLSVLQQKNRTTEEEIRLSAVSGMGYIMGYAGTLTTAQLANITIDSYTGSTFTLDTSATSGITAGDTLFDVGDYIQPASSRYTYQVTSAVFGSDISLGLVDVSVHRPIFTSSSDGGVDITGAGTNGLNVADNCSFHVKALKFPTYTLQPGQLFTFDSDFEFIEVIL